MAAREPDVPASGARLVCASGVLLGVAMLAYLAARRPHMLAANFEVYRVAAAAAVDGESFYAVAPDRFPDFFYLYPPITVLQFVPFLAVGLWAGFALHTLTELAVGLALAAVIVRWIERYRSLRSVDRALIAGFVLASIHTVPSLFYGQVNLRMALLVALGLFLLERPSRGASHHVCEERPSRDDTGGEDGERTVLARDDGVLAGVSLGAAALLKVFPAAVGLWLLRRRDRRAVAAAIATGLGGLAAGALVFGPGATRTYVVDTLLPRSDGAAFVGGLDPAAPYVTVRRPLSILFPDLAPTLLSALAALVLLPALGYVYTRLETPTDRLVGAHATLLVIFVAVPSYPLYYVVTFGTLVPTLYLLADRPSRLLIVAGALLANVVVTLENVRIASDALPAAIGSPLLTVATPPLTVATPVLVGCLLMLGGCVRHRYRRVRDADESVRRRVRDPDRPRRVDSSDDDARRSRR